MRYFQFAGAAREQFAPGLRVTFHKTYAIYYPLVDAIVIIRVVHGAREVAALAESGGFVE